MHFVLKKIIYTFVFLILLTSCSNQSSSNSKTAVAASGNEAQSIMSPMTDVKNMKTFFSYVDNSSAGDDLTADQKSLLDKCSLFNSDNSTSSNISSLTEISGSGCPLSYKLSISGNKSASSASVIVNISYRLNDPSLNPNAKITALDCQAKATIQQPDSENSSISATIKCSIVTSSGGLALDMSLNSQNSPTQFAFSLQGQITANAKVVSLYVSMLKDKSADTVKSTVLINGQASTDDFGLTDLGSVLN